MLAFMACSGIDPWGNSSSSGQADENSQANESSQTSGTSSQGSSASSAPVAQAHVQADIDALAIGYAPGDSAANITQNLTLASVGPIYGSAITWESLDTGGRLADDGTVTRPPFTPGATGITGDAVVSIRATAALEGANAQKTFSNLRIKPIGPTDADKVAHEKALLTDASITYGKEVSKPIETATNVTMDLGLGKTTAGTARTQGMEYNEVAIAWTSAPSGYISSVGIVTRPEFGQGNVLVTLTATLTCGGASDTRVYSITVLQKPDPSSFFPVFYNSDFERSVSIPNAGSGTSGSGIDRPSSITLAFTKTNSYTGFGGQQSLYVSSSSGGNRILFNSYANCNSPEGRTNVTFWLRGSGTGESGSLAVQMAASNRYWSLGTMTGPQTEYVVNNSISYGDYTGSFTLNDWTKITLNLGTYDPSTGKLYVRGNGSYAFLIDEIGYE